MGIIKYEGVICYKETLSLICKSIKLVLSL